MISHFYPRSPCGERHLDAWKPCDVCHFYPRSPCGERQQTKTHKIAAHGISIHALLAESDDTYTRTQSASRVISIHALLAESDTKLLHPSRTAKVHFYPRSPCGERHLRVLDGSKSSIISIHALLAESDMSSSRAETAKTSFLSTLSLRRATSTALKSC